MLIQNRPLLADLASPPSIHVVQGISDGLVGPFVFLKGSELCIPVLNVAYSGIKWAYKMSDFPDLPTVLNLAIYLAPSI